MTFIDFYDISIDWIDDESEIIVATIPLFKYILIDSISPDISMSSNCHLFENKELFCFLIFYGKDFLNWV